jgi:hypothetical protein
MSDKISVTDSIQYLAQTDEAFGQLKAVMKGLEYRLKVCKAQEFLKGEGAAGLREQQAYASEAYIKMVQDYQDAVMDYETVAAKRETRILTIEVWRSQNANKRQGNI